MAQPLNYQQKDNHTTATNLVLFIGALCQKCGVNVNPESLHFDNEGVSGLLYVKGDDTYVRLIAEPGRLDRVEKFISKINANYHTDLKVLDCGRHGTREEYEVRLTSLIENPEKLQQIVTTLKRRTMIKLTVGAALTFMGAAVARHGTVNLQALVNGSIPESAPVDMNNPTAMPPKTPQELAFEKKVTIAQAEMGLGAVATVAGVGTLLHHYQTSKRKPSGTFADKVDQQLHDMREEQQRNDDDGISR